VNTWTRMLCSVQWCIGENDTTCGSFICRKENSASDWDRYPAITSAAGQSSCTGETSHSKSRACEQQKITNTDYTYRTPFFESQAQYERAQISLMDEQFGQFMAAQSLPNLAQVFANELQSIDSDVLRLQIACPVPTRP
jgi:hypothetical protein